MTGSDLPRSARLAAQLRLTHLIVAIPSLTVIVIYLWMLLDLAGTSFRDLALSIGLYGAIIGVFTEVMSARLLRPVSVYLDAHVEEDRVDPQLTRAAFQTTIGLPRRLMQLMLFDWAVAPIGIFSIASLIGMDSFGFNYQLFVLLVAGVLGGLIASAVTFFLMKRQLATLRQVLTSEIRDPVERAALVPQVSLPRKVQFVVLGAVVGSAMLTLTLAQSQMVRGMSAHAMQWQTAALSGLAAELDEGASFSEAMRSVVPNQALLPYPVDFGLLDVDELVDFRSSSVVAFAGVIAEAVKRGDHSGELNGGMSMGLVSWRKLDDQILIAGLPGGAATGSMDSFYLGLFIALVLSGGASLGVAFLLADDFQRATRALTEEAERMAGGDLSEGRAWEAEDEMGDLARAFERMGGALRATVGRVAEAADRVDLAASEIAQVSSGVAMASADQVRRIQQANELMMQIKEQVTGVSNSAQALNVSVEESSSSILELGAAGDELNDTATVLSSKVEDVSGSIEQMVRSVKQVGSTTEALADAAGDTSSSMEEMASAMRAVDTTAELTAKLSTDVVNLAESGQQRVTETISGMEAIRDATDVAEKVIRGLGHRAKEIGGILDVIDDVADETNLLALNAAIIAAQAGEHGRAFSVVADEIKELADRVLASTKEIGGLIRSVQEESENAIGAIEAGSASVATGVERSAEAGTALEEINRASHESGRRIAEIVSAVREQTKATTHVVTLMEGVRDGVMQISTASSEQDRGNEVVYRSVVTMKEVAQQVRRTTEEQSRGFTRIRESVEGVRETVETINASLQDQSTACSQVAAFLEQVFDGTRSNEEAAQRMGTSMKSLVAQAQALRDDVAKFKL